MSTPDRASKALTPTPTIERPRFIKLTEAAERLFGEATVANRRKLKRLADRGELRAVRVGHRGDRHYSTADIDRMLGVEVEP